MKTFNLLMLEAFFPTKFQVSLCLVKKDGRMLRPILFISNVEACLYYAELNISAELLLVYLFFCSMLQTMCAAS